MLQFLLGHSATFLSRRNRRSYICLIFKRSESTIIEIRRHNHCTPNSAAGGDLNGLALRGRDEAALLTAEFGHRY